jgi:hypothetical protein
MAWLGGLLGLGCGWQDKANVVRAIRWRLSGCLHTVFVVPKGHHRECPGWRFCRKPLIWRVLLRVVVGGPLLHEVRRGAVATRIRFLTPRRIRAP